MGCVLGGIGFDWSLGPRLILTQKIGKEGDFLIWNRKLGEEEESNSWSRRMRAYKKDSMQFYLSVYYFFFPKKSMQRERQRERHGNHVLAAKHRKIIGHNLILFIAKESILPLKFALLTEMPCDFRKRNAGLVFYLMAEGGTEDKKNREKEKGGSLYRGRPRGAEGQHICCELGSQCTRR